MNEKDETDKKLESPGGGSNNDPVEKETTGGTRSLTVRGIEDDDDQSSEGREIWTEGEVSCDGDAMPSQTPQERPEGRREEPKDRVSGNDLEDIFGPVISRYTRAQAIEDGVLVAVDEKLAAEAGFRVPIALTRAVWSLYVVVPDGVRCQDETGRLWDVLVMCRYGISRGMGHVSELMFELHVRNDNRAGDPPLVTLKADMGPDDDGSPCMTIMLPEED